MKKILIVEDHYLVRLSLNIVLNELYPQAQVFEAIDFETMNTHIRSEHFELVLLDIDIPEGKGIQMINIIRECQPHVIILVCSAADEQESALPYVIAGANGFVSKSAERQEMIKAITTVMAEQKYVSDSVQELLLDAASPKRGVAGYSFHNRRLSDRENEVMHLMLKGKWVKEIAAELNIQANTVSTYKARIFQKMGVTSVIELLNKTNRR